MRTLLFFLLLAQYSEAKPADNKPNLPAFQVEDTFINCAKNRSWAVSKTRNKPTDSDSVIRVVLTNPVPAGMQAVRFAFYAGHLFEIEVYGRDNFLETDIVKTARIAFGPEHSVIRRDGHTCFGWAGQKNQSATIIKMADGQGVFTLTDPIVRSLAQR